jgi:L-lysine 2,3-aminomutase
LSSWLRDLPWPVAVVVHANHANEIDVPVADALARLRDAGATVLNQAVLLRGVNDDAGVLADLSERLFAAGVLPYYLHQLDRVAGTAHFEVDDARALELHAQLQATLPGYLVPRLVREVAGAPSKTPLPSLPA